MSKPARKTTGVKRTLEQKLADLDAKKKRLETMKQIADLRKTLKK